MALSRESEVRIPANGDRKAVRLSSSDHFLTVLAKSLNPDTNKPYTDAELAGIFHYPPKAVRQVLMDVGLRESLIPEVRRDSIPENERAFFMGLALGDFSVNRIEWGRKKFVSIGTESPSQKKRKLLTGTVGTWGSIRESKEAIRIYIGSPTFDFMINPPINARFLDSKARFAPFLLGALTAKLSDRNDRISLSNESLLERIHRKFANEFGFSMGNFRIEERKSQTNNREETGEVKKVPVVILKSPGEVFASLLRVQSVTSLPFLRDVARLSSV